MLEIKGLSKQVIENVLQKVEREYLDTLQREDTTENFTNWLVVSRVLQAFREGEKIISQISLTK
jgi:hypothetical protein